MLSDETLEILNQRLVRRYENLNTYILKQIGETIKKIGELTPTKARQLENVLKYGGSFEKITKEIARITNLNVKDIYEIYEKMAIKDQQFAKQFYNYRNIDYIPYNKNIPLKNEVDALARITANNFMNFSNTEALGYGIKNKKGKIIYKGLRDTYNKIIDEGILSISQGKETFDQEMSRIIKSLGDSGLRVIYDNGYTRRLDSSVRMQLNDGLRNLHNELQEIFGNEFGADMIEVSHHENPAKDHEDTVDGKQFARLDILKQQIENGTETQIKLEDIEGARVKVKGKWYYDFDTINNSLARQVGTLNCYHYIFTGILGISKPAYTEEELEKAKERNNKGFNYEGKHYTLYETEQLMRKLELELRKAKDEQIMGRASGIVENVENAQNRITKLTYKYNEIVKLSGLPSQLQRAKVSQYRRVNISKLK